MKTTSNSGILKTIYHNGSYLLLLGKRKLQILKFHRNNFSSFKTNASLFYAPPYSKRCTLMRVNLIGTVDAY